MEKALTQKLETRLQRVYSDPDKVKEAIRLIGNYLDAYEKPEKTEKKLSEKDSILITYGNTIVKEKSKGLEVLHDFLKKYVHILQLFQLCV